MVKPSQTPGAPARPRGFRQLVLWAGAHPLLCACCFFALAFALRLLWGSRPGPIVMTIYPDEIRYLHLARSIAQGGPLFIQGQPAQFQKILYPLLISPAFLLARDPLVQVKLIEVINCLAMASIVFPVALLAKKLSAKPAALLLALVFAVALPDFKYTATFMSEPLSWPLYLWVFYLFHIAMAEKQPRKRLPRFALFGFFTWLAYLTKEIAAAFLIAAAATLVLEGIRDKKWKQNGLSLAVVLSAFFAPFFLVKQILFSGAGNSYNGSQSGWDQVGLSALKAPGAFGYLVYSTAVLFLAAILSFYILPVLLPLSGLRKPDKPGRENTSIYLFTMLSLAVAAGAIAYTCSIREPREGTPPYLHLRLLAPMAIPFVILCFDLLLSKDGAKQKQKRGRGRKTVLPLTAALCVSLAALLPTVPLQESWFNRASLSPAFLTGLLTFLGMGKAAANGVWLAFLLPMLALAAAGAFCFVRGKKKAVLAMLLCAMLAVGAADNLMSYRLLAVSRRMLYDQEMIAMSLRGREPEQYARRAMDLLCSREPATSRNSAAHAAAAASEFILQAGVVPGKDIVVFMRFADRQLFDTYISPRLPRIFVYPEELRRWQESGAREHSLRKRVDYIVVTEDFNPFEHVEVLFEQSPYLVLRNLDPAKLSFSGEKVDPYG